MSVVTQFLSAEGEASQLREQPSGIPIVSYDVPSPRDSRKLDVGNVGAHLNENTTDLQKMLMIFEMFGRACDGLMANESALAAVKVWRRCCVAW